LPPDAQAQPVHRQEPSAQVQPASALLSLTQLQVSHAQRSHLQSIARLSLMIVSFG
jgi:hypothetical protein